jgi:hypothetical protein
MGEKKDHLAEVQEWLEYGLLEDPPGVAIHDSADELEKLRKLKAKLEHYAPSVYDLLMQEIEAGR